MEHHGGKAGNVKPEDPGHGNQLLHPGIAHLGPIQGVHDPRVIDVVADISKGNEARPALERIKKIFRVGVPGEVGLPRGPDKDPVKRVVKNRQTDEGHLKKRHKGHALQKLDLAVVGRGPEEDEGI